MKISIITVTLNSDQTIRDSLNSVFSQTYKNIEHIIVDGGSNDQTEKICNELGINFLSFPGSSLSFRRGYAIEESKNKYTVFVDADQRLLKYNFDLECEPSK